MNAAFLIMSSAALAGADPAPPPPPPAAPVVVSGVGCTNCGPPAYSAYSSGCCESTKPGLLDRIKARFSKKSSDCGCTPAPAYTPCDTCSTGAADRPNLLDKLKARWGKKKAGPCCDPCATTYSSGCATALPVGAPPVTTPGTGTVPPKEMPKPKDTPKPKETPKAKDNGGNASGVPVPLPPIPMPPVNGAGLLGSGSPY